MPEFCNLSRTKCGQSSLIWMRWQFQNPGLDTLAPCILTAMVIVQLVIVSGSDRSIKTGWVGWMFEEDTWSHAPSALRGFEAIHLSRLGHKWCKALVMVVLQLLAGPSVEVPNHGKYTELRHVCPCVLLVCSTLFTDSTSLYSMCIPLI